MAGESRQGVGQGDRIIEWIDQAGWNPQRPNEKCASAIARPPEFARLDPRDADGAHFIIAYLEYDRLLDRLKADDQSKHVVQLAAATYVVLLHNGTPPVSMESWDRERLGFERWSIDVWGPSGQRMMQALEEKGDPDWVIANREQFEPALTVQEVMQGRILSMDVASDMTAMARGIQMHTQGVPRLRKTEHAAIEFADFMDCIRFLNTPEESVSSYGPNGLLRVDSLLVKSGLDAKTGRVDNSPLGIEPPEDLAVPSSEDALQALREVELLDAVRSLSTQRFERGRGAAAMRVVQENLVALVRRETSIRRLSLEVGISRDALQAAYEFLTGQLRRKFGQKI